MVEKRELLEKPKKQPLNVEKYPISPYLDHTQTPKTYHHTRTTNQHARTTQTTTQTNTHTTSLHSHQPKHKITTQSQHFAHTTNLNYNLTPTPPPPQNTPVPIDTYSPHKPTRTQHNRPHQQT